MTLGEKIAKQRKACNYTQEQLAEMLGISRQSVSKWESDLAYPETDKLIKMGRLFDCSMDYLLMDEINEKQGGTENKAVSVLLNVGNAVRKQFREHKSEKQVWGMPLYHIGRDARGVFAVGLKARGIVAVGLRARGAVALGLVSCGILSVGLLSAGLIALGTLALGLLSVGSVALGLFAAGAISFGIVSFGALSVGCFSSGALAIGHYIAVGDHARAMIAIGESEAAGTVYAHLGNAATADMVFVRTWLDTKVPGLLAWAKFIFLLYLG